MNSSTRALMFDAIGSTWADSADVPWNWVLNTYRDRLVNLAREAFGANHFPLVAGRPNCALYARVSSPSQTRSGRTMLSEQIILSWEESQRRGWGVTAIYWDVATAGSVLREGFRRMLADIRTCRLDAIIAWKDDRIIRGIDTALDLSPALLEYRLSTSGELEIAYVEGTPFDHALMPAVALAADYERAGITARMTAGRMIRAKEGKLPSGKPPFGYQTDPVTQRIVSHPTEHEVLCKVAAMAMADASSRSIATMLNASGVERPNGRPWTESRVNDILHSRALYGEWQFGSQLIPLPASAMDRVHWESMIARRAERRRNLNIGRPPHQRNPLAGLIRCTVCGYKMSQHNIYQRYTPYVRKRTGEKVIYRHEVAQPILMYRCKIAAAMDPAYQPCRTPLSVRNDWLLPLIWERTITMMTDVSHLATIIRDQAILNGTTDVGDGIAVIDHRLAELVDDEVYYAQHARKAGLSNEALSVLLRPIAEERVALWRRRSELIERPTRQQTALDLESYAKALARSCAAALPRFNDEEKSDFLRNLDTSIELHSDNTFDVRLRLSRDLDTLINSRIGASQRDV